jgi:hypothetical protein
MHEAWHARRCARIPWGSPVIDKGQQADDLTQLIQVFENAKALCEDIRSDAQRRRLLARIRAAERRLREAAAQVLDNRFNAMSDTILRWWNSIRPEEFVDFAGIRRRAGGATFVNLVAALHPDPGAPAVERDALGVYSDSQLNAIGLSIFLARTELLSSSLVVLDDPIPGSDPDHRLTFVQNTLSKLLDEGVQVILTTYDGKLADWTIAVMSTAAYSDTS